MQWICVALFGSRITAASLQQRLVRAGLVAEVHDQLWMDRLWFMPKSSAGARLEVIAPQLAVAEKLLRDWDTVETAAALRDVVRCPECRSLHVDYPQFVDHSILTNAALGLIAKLGLLEKKYYCTDCNHTWPHGNES